MSSTTRCGCGRFSASTWSGAPPGGWFGRRNVPAGDYRGGVGHQFGLQGPLQALVRPTVAPTIIPPGGAETCAQATDASNGGFFTGDTSTSVPDYGAGCDAPHQP